MTREVNKKEKFTPDAKDLVIDLEVDVLLSGCRTP